ncbi:hypothetical protein SISNIDRAFT_470447 [Sistotremastrum niveocremeum HHB9708]|uniref:Uncharacterized protein n=1 Tax=Sistotremastrum niveocremeum HHB9708 TaxID=1314777 RepID=A0A164NXK0_9AGAM|nr:hypothetical protein SISNIDRAFT_470447 [Sistotremastrum niveocremeum HHB9708]
MDESTFPPAFLVKARISPSLSVQWLRSQEAVQIADTVDTAPFLAVVFSYPLSDQPMLCDLILPVTNVEPGSGSYLTILDYDPEPSATNINEPFLPLPKLSSPIRLHAFLNVTEGFRFSDARVGHPLSDVLTELLWLECLEYQAVTLGPIWDRNTARNEAKYSEEVSSFIITENYAIEGIESAIKWAQGLKLIDLQPKPRLTRQHLDSPALQEDLLALQSFPIRYPPQKSEAKPQATQDSGEELCSWDDGFHISLRIAPDIQSPLNYGNHINLLFIDVLDTIMSRSTSIISTVRSWIGSLEMFWDDQALLEFYMHCEGLTLVEKPNLDYRSLSKKVFERMTHIMGASLSESARDTMVDAVCSPPPRDGLLDDINSLRQSGCSVIALCNMDAETFTTWCRRYGFEFCDSICQSAPDTCLEVLEKFKVNPVNALVVSSKFYRDLEPILSVVPTAQISDGMTEQQQDASAISGIRGSLNVVSWKTLYNSESYELQRTAHGYMEVRSVLVEVSGNSRDRYLASHYILDFENLASEGYPNVGSTESLNQACAFGSVAYPPPKLSVLVVFFERPSLNPSINCGRPTNHVAWDILRVVSHRSSDTYKVELRRARELGLTSQVVQCPDSTSSSHARAP